VAASRAWGRAVGAPMALAAVPAAACARVAAGRTGGAMGGISPSSRLIPVQDK
jgi:hypothetical protein